MPFPPPHPPLRLDRNKAILFYFNILRCASPSVLINLQCPTTQVSAPTAAPAGGQLLLPFCSPFRESLWLTFVYCFFVFFFPVSQLCVSKCPDRFATYREMKRNYKNWEYYKQFCRPGFDNPDKVRRCSQSHPRAFMNAFHRQRGSTRRRHTS